MPYEGERAGYRPLERIVNSEQVRGLLARARQWQQENTDYPVEPKAAPEVEGILPDLIIAFDSSWQETPAGALQRDVYPSAQVGYITLSTVLLRTAELSRISQNRPMDPAQYRRTRDESTTPAALPGANLITGDNPSARTSFRSELYRMLATALSSDRSDGTAEEESLLSAYERLLAGHHKGATKCPYSKPDPDAPDQDESCQLFVGNDRERKIAIPTGQSKCPCPKQRPIWSTDATRIHERFMEDGPNGNQLGAVAQVLERLELLRYLRLIENNDNFLSQAHRIAFISDGQLAVFGGPSWMAQALEMEIQRVNAKVRERTGHDMIIVAVEKTGRFVDHFELIDKTGAPGVPRFPPRHLFVPTNDYITGRIAPNETNRPYGNATHFGRKLFYKAANGYRLVVTIAFLNPQQRDLTKDDISLYPSLGRTCALLDGITSSQSPNSLMPIRLAHHAAAIPIRPSISVLQNLAEGLMNYD